MGAERLDPIQSFHSRTVACYATAINEIVGGRIPIQKIPSEFVGLTPIALNAIFVEIRKELDREVVLTTVAITEDEIRTYFGTTRVRRHISGLRTLFERYGNRTRFEAILEQWKPFLHPPRVVSRFKQVLKYRHWLAHGRSKRMRPMEFTPEEADQRSRDLLAAIASIA